MSIINLNSENFKETVLESEGIVVVDFYADWCGPCKMIAPFVEEIAEENPDIKVCKVNVDKYPEFAIKYGVVSIPDLMVFKNGEKVNEIIGYHTKDEILLGIK